MSCVKRACSDRLLLPLCLHLPFVLIHFRIRGSLGIVDAVMLIGSAERMSVCKTQRNPPVFFGIVGIRLLFQTAHDIPISFFRITSENQDQEFISADTVDLSIPADRIQKNPGCSKDRRDGVSGPFSSLYCIFPALNVCFLYQFNSIILF